jgi:hypothetical protein
VAISFFSEMKRRSVFRVGLVYLAAAWLLLQVVATVAPILDLAYCCYWRSVFRSL